MGSKSGEVEEETCIVEQRVNVSEDPHCTVRLLNAPPAPVPSAPDPEGQFARNHLLCMYTNADNLLNKRNELEATLYSHKPDIICITEVAPKHCTTPMSSSELQIQGFDLCFNDVNFKRGVAIYTSTHLNAVPYDGGANLKGEENCWIRLSLRGNDRLLIGCVYRSPNSSERNNQDLIQMLTEVCNKGDFTHLLICGDFNLPDINWRNTSVTAGPESVSSMFLECTRDCFLWQHVTKPTHKRGQQNANILDLVFTNEQNMVDNIEHCAPLGKSHHDILIWKLNCYTTKKSSIREIYNYRRGDFDLLRRLVAEENMGDIGELPVQEAWVRFLHVVHTCVTRSVPTVKLDPSRTKKPAWIEEDVLRKIKEKNKAYKQYRRTSSLTDYKKYTRLRNQCRWESRKSKATFERNLARTAKEDPKEVFKYINSKLKTKSDISELETAGGTVTLDIDKANILNDFFVSVFTQENGNVPQCPRGGEIRDIPELQISEEKVRTKLIKLKANKAAGPDDLNPRILKELAPIISHPLAQLMQNSLRQGIVPNDWREAHICAIHKKGAKTLPNNYRPVSLTSQVCKIMESIIRDHIFSHLMDNNIISRHQHGFIPGRSCATQLLECLDKWTEILDEGDSLDVVYLDFSKAFDSVPHRRLIEKMKALGIDGPIMKWCEAFLHERRQRVTIRGSKSEWAEVTSGVPQGSVIGPLMFVIYVNDMPGIVEGYLKLFADDAKLFRRVTNRNEQESMQRDLDNLIEWANKWQMCFNETKCQVLHLGYRNLHSPYYMNGVILGATEEVKDLGVLIDINLKLHQHTEAQVNKANRVLGMLRRSFEHLDKKTLTWLYKALVRPHLEYANIITYPRFAAQERMLERVQRRATKQLSELREKSYTERLEELKLPSLHYRFRRGDMIELYKITHNMYNTQCDLVRLSDSSTRGHSLKLFKPRCHLSLRQNIFPFRSIDAWNSLTEDIVQANSLNAFKNKLDAYWSQDQYSYI